MNGQKLGSSAPQTAEISTLGYGNCNAVNLRRISCQLLFKIRG